MSMYLVTPQKATALRKKADTVNGELVSLGKVGNRIVVDVDDVMTPFVKNCEQVPGDTAALYAWADFEPNVVNLAVYLTAAKADIMESGFRSTDYGSSATKWTAWGVTCEVMRTRQQATDEELAYLEQVRTWAWTQMLIKPGEEFWEKVASVLKNDTLRQRLAGAVACLPNLLAREEAKQAHADALTAFAGGQLRDDAFAPVGIGAKVDVNGIIERVTGFDTCYGYMHIYTFRGADGYAYVWKTTSAPRYVTAAKNSVLFDKGDRVIVAGTVKGKDVYRGMHQVMLTRCKLTLTEARK